MKKGIGLGINFNRESMSETTEQNNGTNNVFSVIGSNSNNINSSTNFSLNNNLLINSKNS